MWKEKENQRALADLRSWSERRTDKLVLPGLDNSEIDLDTLPKRQQRTLLLSIEPGALRKLLSRLNPDAQLRYRNILLGRFD
ncbi:hypothetical protein [Paraburkholderia mimosarum]|uniref:hypothetical protein n=1 Tax=Paraburkholderia mimosarum TaxID=312026 RepID=UPI00047F1D1A|nr:hypothetical protein [Paraburkholderia mimosarum]